MHDPAPSTRARDITLLAASTLTVMAGAAIAAALPGLARAFEEVPRSAFLTKLALTLPALAITLSAPLMGWLGDQTGRRRLLFLSALVFSFAGSAGLWLDSLTSILAARAILGVAVGGIMTTIAALISEFFRGPERLRFVGLQSSTAAFGGLVFLTLGGRLAEEGWRAPFWVYLAGIPIGLAALIFIEKPPKTELSAEDFEARDALPPQWRIVGAASFLVFVGQLAFYVVPTQLPFFLESRLGAGGTAIGLALGTSTLLGGLVALVAKKVQGRIGSLRSIACAFFAFALAFSVLGFTESYPTALAAMVFLGTGMGLLMPATSVLVMSAVPSTITGRAIGVMTACLFLGQFLSPLLAEPLLTHRGFSTTFLVIAGAMFLTTIGVLITRSRSAAITIQPS